jgi:hypothetical protein
MTSLKTENKMIRTSKNWEVIFPLAEKMGLTKEQKLFLLALREVERGSEGNEFNIKVVKDTNLEEQTKVAILSIKANDKRYHQYVLTGGKRDFLSFFSSYAGPMKTGWHTHDCVGRAVWRSKMREAINNITKEFEDGKTRHAIGNYGMGETDRPVEST